MHSECVFFLHVKNDIIFAEFVGDKALLLYVNDVIGLITMKSIIYDLSYRALSLLLKRRFHLKKNQQI